MPKRNRAIVYGFIIIVAGIILYNILKPKGSDFYWGEPMPNPMEHTKDHD